MDTGEIIRKFCDQCVWTKIVYNEYRILYETSQKRLDLLSTIANHFFHDLQNILIEYILLSICKLTDPAHSRGHDNLTVKYVLELVDPETKKQLGLDDLSNRIHGFRKYVQDARHKLIAHLDREATLSQGSLGAFPQGAIEQFWSDLQEFIDRIHNRYCGGVFPIDAVNMYNAQDLVETLKKSVHYDDYFSDKLKLKFGERERMRFKDA